MKHLNIKHFPSNKHIYLTKEGLDGLKAKLDKLRQERTIICKELMDMDPKEKVEHIISTDAIRTIEINEMEVEKLDEILQHSSVVSSKKSLADSVRVGSTVCLKDGDKAIKLKLVDSIEVDPFSNRISNESPLGRALVGRRLHDIVSFMTPKGKQSTYKVDAIL